MCSIMHVVAAFSFSASFSDQRSCSLSPREAHFFSHTRHLVCIHHLFSHTHTHTHITSSSFYPPPITIATHRHLNQQRSPTGAKSFEQAERQSEKIAKATMGLAASGSGSDRVASERLASQELARLTAAIDSESSAGTSPDLVADAEKQATAIGFVAAQKKMRDECNGRGRSASGASGGSEVDGDGGCAEEVAQVVEGASVAGAAAASAAAAGGGAAGSATAAGAAAGDGGLAGAGAAAGSGSAAAGAAAGAVAGGAAAAGKAAAAAGGTAPASAVAAAAANAGGAAGSSSASGQVRLFEHHVIS